MVPAWNVMVQAWGSCDGTALLQGKPTRARDRKDEELPRYILVLETIRHSEGIAVRFKERRDSGMTPRFLI